MQIISKTCSLDKALSYQNENVVRRFTKVFDLSFDEANEVFYETKKWLWLINQPGSDIMTVVHHLRIIDEMWHNFILFTGSYTNYCIDCFGRYIHHRPITENEEVAFQKELEEDSISARERQKERFCSQCLFVFSILDLDTLLKWYVEYPERYGEQFFNHCRKNAFLFGKPTSELLNLVDQIKTGQIIIRKSS